MHYEYRTHAELIGNTLTVISDQTCADPVTYLVQKDGSVWASALIELHGDDRDDLEVLYARLPVTEGDCGPFPNGICREDIDLAKLMSDKNEREEATGFAHEYDSWVANLI